MYSNPPHPDQDPFRNIPWTDVPQHMKGNIIVEYSLPPLRLLGGAPSKLAALAAARKKKEAEQKAGNATDNQETPQMSISLLDRLGTKPSKPEEATSEEAPLPQSLPSQIQRAYPIRKRKSPSPPPPVADRRPTPAESTIELPTLPLPQAPSIRADPSIFAQAMCGGSAPSLSTQTEPLHFKENMLPTLYGRASVFADSNPFAGPSPDDIVTQAQAKGSALR